MTLKELNKIWRNILLNILVKNSSYIINLGIAYKIV